MSFASPSLPQLVALVALTAIVAAWSFRLAKRRGRWLVAFGPIAAAAVLGFFVDWPAAAPAPDAPQEEATAAGHAEERVAAPVRMPERTEDAGPRPNRPPPRIVVDGTWSDEDRLLVESALTAALVGTSAASGRDVVFTGAGRELPATRQGVPRYAISGTWKLRVAPDSTPTAIGSVPEVAGWGPDPYAARRDAARRTAASVAAGLDRTP